MAIFSYLTTSVVEISNTRTKTNMIHCNKDKTKPSKNIPQGPKEKGNMVFFRNLTEGRLKLTTQNQKSIYKTLHILNSKQYIAIRIEH